MTFNKRKVLFGMLSGFAAVSAIAAVAAVAASCSKTSEDDKHKKDVLNSLTGRSKIIHKILTKEGKNEDNGQMEVLWRGWWNSPFAQLRSIAADLDKAIDLNKSSTFKPLIDKGEHEATFALEAEKQINLLKEDIKMYANSPFWKKLRESNTTVGFTTRGGPSDLDVSNMNSFGLLQPTENSLLYTSPDYAELPGLGLKFPTPKLEEGTDLLDDWYSFGWKASYGEVDVQNKAINQIIGSFSDSFDHLIYVYNDGEKTDKYTNELGESYEQQLAKTENFLPARLVKGSTDNIHFMGRSGWIATYGVIGMHWLLREYSKLFGMPKAELDGLIAKEKFKVNQNPLPLFTEDDLMVNSENKKVFKEGKSPYKKHRKDGTDINFWVTSVHSLDQAITLGVRPNLFVKGSLSTSGHDRPTGINYLIETSGQWIKGLPRFGEIAGTEKVEELKNTYLKIIYDQNVNTMTSGMHNLSKQGNIMQKENWKEYPELLSNIAYTSRRFREQDRVEPTGADKKYSQDACLIGYDEYIKEISKK
ncbi:hypothetical protein OF376_01835 [Ureaplasma miroungigenitalium]|uniref:ABC transporter substrate-binding protein n=1 Tax=Ureaplasma miroungigenitalium TaxID=1042321 RepID=A0ABT3BMN1_9BACT|nr:hypothetical protein [Ureaplasma miroungigenitalium]MCV3728504.1 hypothetical protein [Ureaplasma miroungigenitalium]MCV3734291.1 hypothetical protein [Ureaplasma miroungigenitalium]